MHERDRELYRQRYNRRLAVHGDDARTLGWTKGRQPHRFEALMRQVTWDPSLSVLDVGCGFGDLGAFLRARGHKGPYLGIDLVEELVDVGRRKHPGLELEVAALEDFDPRQTFDLVVASGVFNAVLRHTDRATHIEDSLRRMVSLAEVATVVDFLTDDVDFRDEDLHYTPIGWIAGRVARLSRRFVIDHSTMPYEYTVTIFADDRVTADTVFAARAR